MKCISVILLICLCNTTCALCSVNENTETKVDYIARLNEIAKKGRDESLNAETFYKKAAELYVELPEEFEEDDLFEWPSDLKEKKRSLLEHWAKSNSDAFIQLKLGTQKQYCRHQYQEDNVWAIGLPSYIQKAKYIIYARLFLLKLSAMESGMTKEAVEDVITCYRFGSHLVQSPITIEQLMGIGLMRISVKTVFLCLAKTDVDPLIMDLLQNRIKEKLSNQNQPLSAKFEKFGHLEAVQMLFQNSDDDSKLKPDEQRALAIRQGLFYEDLDTLSRGKTIQDIEAAFAYCEEFLSMSPWQVREKGLNFWEDIDRLTNGNPLVRSCMFNAPMVSRTRAHQIANRDALLTTLALLRYKQDKGSFPKDLNELLSNGYLNQLPIDPYSGKSLVYKRKDDDFMLYSLGKDFDDDGGTYNKYRQWGEGKWGGDHVFWPVQ